MVNQALEEIFDVKFCLERITNSARLSNAVKNFPFELSKPLFDKDPMYFEDFMETMKDILNSSLNSDRKYISAKTGHYDDGTIDFSITEQQLPYIEKKATSDSSTENNSNIQDDKKSHSQVTPNIKIFSNSNLGNGELETIQDVTRAGISQGQDSKKTDFEENVQSQTPDNVTMASDENSIKASISGVSDPHNM